jgi:hypothetical protein
VPVIPAPGRLRQEEQDFQGSLDYIARVCLKNYYYYFIYIYIYNYLYLKIRKATAVLDFAFLTSFAYPAPQSPLPWKSSSLHWNNTTLKLAFYPKIVSFVINMK